MSTGLMDVAYALHIEFHKAETEDSMGKHIWVVGIALALTYAGCDTGRVVIEGETLGDDDDFDGGEVVDGLIAHYPFNGNANDATGNGNHGAVHGAALTADRFGESDAAYLFDGQDDGIAAMVGDELSVPQLTLAVWIAIGGPGTWNPRIVGVGPEGTSHQHYALVQEGDGAHKGLFFMSSEGQHDGEDEYWASTTLPPDLSWHHLAATVSGEEIVLYVDGSPDSSHQPYRGIPEFTRGLLQIGHSDDSPPSDCFQGAIDDVRMYDYPLSQEQITELFAANE